MASPFKKLKLVAEDELHRLQDRQLKQYEPNLRVLSKTRAQIGDLLSPGHDSSLTPNERLRLLDMLRNRFRELKNMALSKSVAVQPEERPSPSIAYEEADIDEDEEPIVEADSAPGKAVAAAAAVQEPDLTLKENILSTIATTSRNEARSLFDKILSNPNTLSYNHRLEAVVGGKTILGSNFINLYKSAFAKRGVNKGMIGFDSFHQALSDIRGSKPIPPAASRPSSSIFHRSVPPGDKPPVLRVYHDID